MRHLLVELFHLSNLLQVLNDHRMVDVKFFGNFSCSLQRIRFDDPLNWSLPISNGQPLFSSFSSLLSPLQNFLNHQYTVHLLVVLGPNALLVLCIVSTTFQPILNSNKKIAQIAFCLTSFP